MIRIYSFERDIDIITDQQAEDAIRGLLPVVQHASDAKE
jgi:hypothetical protein